MTLMELINLNDFKLFWKDTLTKAEYRDIMEQIGVQFWIKNSQRQLRDLYILLDIFKASIASYVKINEQKFNYLIETAKEDFIGLENINTVNGVTQTNQEQIAYNRDFFGGEGKVGKDTGTNAINSNNTIKYNRIDKKDKASNFKDINNNSLLRTLENKLFETFFIDESITW